MSIFRFIALAFAVGVVTAPTEVSGPAQAPTPGPIAVGPNVQVSAAFGALDHAEVIAAADPDHPGRLIACSMVTREDRNLIGQHCYSSFDAGRTWAPSLELVEGGVSGDPAVFYGKGDTVFAASLVTPLTVPRAFDYDTRIYRSTDGGRTFKESARFLFIDREYVVVDKTGGKYDGRVYVNGVRSVRGMDDERAAAIWLYRSLDGGDTFLGPAIRATLEGGNLLGLSNQVVLSDGTVAMVIGHIKSGRTSTLAMNRVDNSANALLQAVTSTDGGETLNPAVTVSDWYLDRPRSEGGVVPVLGADLTAGPFKDRLYAVWPDARAGRTQVYLSYSADKGKTWSAAQLINDDRAPAEMGQGPDHLLPAVAVNKHGVVAVAWYDRRDHADNLGWRVRLAASFDGGETFTASVPVADRPNVYTADTHWHFRAPTVTQTGAGPLMFRFLLDPFFTSGGHTTGLAADAAGVFHPVWVDNRTGLAQIWTAPVTVRGEAVKHGSSDLASLDDLSGATTLDLTDYRSDRRTNTITVVARVKNTSKAPIAAPLKVRVIDVGSDLAVAEVVNADNGQRGGGAIWDFSALIPGGTLAPDALSGPRTLEFRVSDVRPSGQGAELKALLMSIKARVYGTSTGEGETTADDKK